MKIGDLIWDIFLLFAGFGIVTSISDGAFWLGSKAVDAHQSGAIVSLVDLNRMLFSEGVPRNNDKRRTSKTRKPQTGKTPVR